jgi:chromosome segregation ATPase
MSDLKEPADSSKSVVEVLKALVSEVAHKNSLLSYQIDAYNKLESEKESLEATNYMLEERIKELEKKIEKVERWKWPKNNK